MRIHITGNAGAGKTTLAQRLERKLGLSASYLDKVVWKTGWRKTSADERRESLRKLMQGTDWLIEGVSKEVRKDADIVVFLDVPRRVCLWQCAKRNWRYLFKSRPDLPEDCPEWRIIPTLIRIIWRFPQVVGMHIMNEALISSRYIVLRDRESVEMWLNEFVLKPPPNKCMQSDAAKPRR